MGSANEQHSLPRQGNRSKRSDCKLKQHAQPPDAHFQFGRQGDIVDQVVLGFHIFTVRFCSNLVKEKGFY